MPSGLSHCYTMNHKSTRDVSPDEAIPFTPPRPIGHGQWGAMIASVHLADKQEKHACKGTVENRAKQVLSTLYVRRVALVDPSGLTEVIKLGVSRGREHRNTRRTDRGKQKL